MAQVRKIENIYVADFETCDCTDKDDVRVWAAGLNSLYEDDFRIWTNIGGFMEYILSTKFTKKRNIEIFFHNLKFDGKFIIPWLAKNSFKYTSSKPEKDEYSTLITDTGQWYIIEIGLGNKKTVTIYDSLKIFPMRLFELPNLYNTPTKKLDESQEFYERVRQIGHIPDSEERQYLYNDCQVLKETLLAHINYVGINFKVTQASEAYSELKRAYPYLKYDCPPLDTKLDTFLRTAYKGGISYVPDQYAGVTFEEPIMSMDINSSYPFQLATKKLPYGRPILSTTGEQPKMRFFWVAEAYIRLSLKPNCVPCLPLKNVHHQNQDICVLNAADQFVMGTVDDMPIKATFCSIDYKTMLLSYNIEVLHWGGAEHFEQRINKKIRDFILSNNEIKVNSKKEAKITDGDKRLFLLAMGQRAKINNNASYGKFGEAVFRGSLFPEWIEEEERVHYCVADKEESSEHQKKYLPIAIATTAYGRQQLVTLANALGKYYLYSDTDSVHFLAAGYYIIEELVKTKAITIDDEELGAWAIEGHYVKGRYLRPKAYLEERADGHLECTLAGLPADKGERSGSKRRSIVTWENFHFGHTFPAEQTNKFRVETLPNGVRLVPTHFTISEKVGKISIF